MVHMTLKFFTFALLCVYLYILEVNTADDLEFWEADPKFDTRRNEKTKKNEEVTKHKSKYKRRKTTSATSEEEETITHRFRATTESESQDSRPVHSHHTRRSGPGFTSKTKSRDKQKGRQGEDDHMSTRFVPFGDTKEDSKKWWWFSDSKNKTGKYSLSPYSIAKQLSDITSQMPEANVTIEILGRTAEYNDIVLLKVAEKKSDVEKYFRAEDSKYIDEIPEKKIIFIVHALSVMGIDRMSVFKYNNYLNKLLSYYFGHLDKFDIFLIPMANPDGYAYTMNRVGDVIWNKNLTPQNGCAGVALDRNFDVAWNATNTSTCSQQYPGATPFSEPETKAVRDVMHRYSHKIIAYMHLHAGSYDPESFKGDAVLYPKGYTDAQSDDDKYIDLKGEIDECIKNASFRYLSVTVDTLHNWYGKVSGTSVDYASTIYGIPYALELVMQIYDNPTADSSNSEENLENMALEQIWGRVIDVVFNSIWRNMHSNDLQ